MNSPCLVISKDYLEMQFSFITVLALGFFFSLFWTCSPICYKLCLNLGVCFKALTKDYSKNKISQDSLVTFLRKCKTQHLCWKCTMLSQETVKLWVHCKFLRKLFSSRDPAVVAVVSQPLWSCLWYRFAQIVEFFFLVSVRLMLLIVYLDMSFFMVVIPFWICSYYHDRGLILAIQVTMAVNKRMK